MRISYNIIDLENSSSTSILHVLSELMPKIRSFTGKVKKVDGSMTKAFKKAIPTDIELPVGVRGEWGLFISNSLGVELRVKIHGPDGLPSNEGYECTHYAVRQTRLGWFKEDSSVNWYGDDEFHLEPFQKMHDYWEMKRKYEKADELEEKARNLRSQFRVISGYSSRVSFV